MKVKVTQKHIDAGKPNEAGLCPVALAIKEALGDPDWFIEVWYDEIIIEEDVLAIPDEVARFAMAFDGVADEEVKPFEFELEDYDVS